MTPGTHAAPPQAKPPASLLQRLAPEKLVIFRALRLGDMLCAVPALRALRKALPDTHIALVGLPWAQQFADRFGRYIDQFFAFPGHRAMPEQSLRQEQLITFYQAMQAERFTLALQLHGSGEISNGIVRGFGARATAGFGVAGSIPLDNSCYFAWPDTGAEPVRLLALTALLGAPSAGTHLEFPLTPDDERELAASGLAQVLPHGGFICIHPGASIRAKCWPAHRFAEVADRLSLEYKLPVVLTGSLSEADLTATVASYMRTEPVDAAAAISIGAMAALMRRARLLICNDTGVSHIAAGLNIPSVVIFSKADIHRWAPLDHELHRCVWDPDGDHVYGVLERARGLLARPHSIL
ncbi:MAG: glycosyltransferase family 9 protein [Pseudomonadota bacterium]